GSYCSLPDDIARKFEAQFYTCLTQNESVDEAMWRTRMELAADGNDIRQCHYLAGAMVSCHILISSFAQFSVSWIGVLIDYIKNRYSTQLHLEWLTTGSSAPPR